MRNAITPVLLVREVRQIEQAVLSQTPAPPLMLRAGFAVAELAREMLGDRGKRVLVLAGPGNNGGDAFGISAVARQSVKADWASDERLVSWPVNTTVTSYHHCFN